MVGKERPQMTIATGAADANAGAAAGLARIGQIALTVRELDRAVAFYRDVLRVPFLFRVPNLAFFDCAGLRLMLSEPEGAGTGHHASVLYFNVPHIQETCSD